MASYEDVIDFWFKETTPGQWFKKDDAFDAKIRSRFLDTYGQIVDGDTSMWRNAPLGRLAEIIVLDQFARNMFRDSPKAYEADPLALELAREAILAGSDKMLSRRQRRFMYMPYMHSELREAHKKAVWLFLANYDFGTLLYEFKHKMIIDRFGRYPHRNAILGRASTPEEEEFLKTHKGF
jgi:uncharacterized protein (DUF924 family)